jgi:hypothetical protein
VCGGSCAAGAAPAALSPPLTVQMDADDSAVASKQKISIMSGGVDLSALDALHAAGKFDQVFDLSRILVLFLSCIIGCCTVSEFLSFQALDGCSKCIQANSQDVECLIRRCRWTIDLSAQKPDTEKLPLMCAQFPLKNLPNCCLFCLTLW